jgi:hypothetical protein
MTPTLRTLLGLGFAAALVAGCGLWPRGFSDEGPIDPAIAGRTLSGGEAPPQGMGVFTFVVADRVKRVAFRQWGPKKLVWYVDDPRQGGEYTVALPPGGYVFERNATVDSRQVDTFTVKAGQDADEFIGGDKLPRIGPPEPPVATVVGADEPLPPGASGIRYTVKDKIVRLILRRISDRAIVWHVDRPAMGTFQLVLPHGAYSLEQHSPLTEPWAIPPRVIYEVLLAAGERKDLKSTNTGPEE